MQIRTELCHVDTLRCIVRVEAWQDGDLRGSALGEAGNAEEAEQRALQRLQDRLPVMGDQLLTNAPAQPSAANETADKPDGRQRQAVETSVNQPRKREKAPATVETLSKAAVDHGGDSAPSETPTDPEDWSDELTAIDLEIKRIGWGRDQEQSYLTRAFGHGSRHKLTRYADLVAYLRQLKLIQANEDAANAPVPIRRGDLLTQGDSMLKQLKWNSDQARAFLQQQLGATSRQQLNDEQLLQFNMLLEEQTLSETKK